MRALAIAHKGTEALAASEIKNLIGSEAYPKDSCVVFDAGFMDLCKAAYISQSVRRVICILQEFTLEKKESFLSQLQQAVENSEIEEWLSPEKTFRAVCESEFAIAQDAEAEAGSFIIEKIKKKKSYTQKVSLDSPDVTAYVFSSGKNCFLGIDLCGFDLSKRDYKVFTTSADIKGTIAYSLLLMAGYDSKKALLDPFCGSGPIPIEAAFKPTSSLNHFRRENFAFLKLKGHIPPDINALLEKLEKPAEKRRIFAYDSHLNYIKSAKKNAKIAGVNKSIEFSRIEAEWLDTKFSKGEIDIIASRPPYSKYEMKKTQALYDSLFYSAQYILSEKGKIALLSANPGMLIKSAEKNNFKASEEKEFWQGNMKLHALVFTKSKKST